MRLRLFVGKFKLKRRLKMLNGWRELFESYIERNIVRVEMSHDIGHIRRVWKNAQVLMTENADDLVVLAAAYFHDIVCYPKNSVKRSQSSRDSSVVAEQVLRELSFPIEKIENVKHCIEAHSFSAGVFPKTDEAKIVQDADRLDALGAVGIARTFYLAGHLGSEMFNYDDPFALNRQLNDSKYALDHFKLKLLKLPLMMQTGAGRIEAQKRVNVLELFLGEMRQEL